MSGKHSGGTCHRRRRRSPAHPGRGARGGGHRFGTGARGKSEFPADWSDEKIIAAIEAVANDASSRKYRRSRDSRVIVEGVHDEIVLRVVIEADGIRIITGHPINVPRNQ